MKEPKKSQLPQRTCQEQRRQERVAAELECLREKLGEVRQVAGRGRFGELDEALGREGGFVGRTLKDQERLSTERLLAAVAFLGMKASEFFERAFPREPVPRYSAGFLTDRREKVRTVPKVDFLSALRDWGTSLEIQPSGAEFSLAAQSFEQLLNADRATAFRMACAAIEAVLVLEPQVLSTESAGNLCRVLSPLADLLRHQGDRNSACELLELAFRLEAQLEDFDLRSRLFRSASYLLCDLAYLDDARWFARRAVRLATLGGDQSSLGKSLYVEGVMLRRCGDGASEPLLKSSLRFLPQEAKSERASVLVALASTKASEGAFSSAKLDLAEASRLLPSKKSTDWARVLMARADIAAKEGDGSEADRLFAEAEELFASAGNVEDVALCQLYRMRSLLSFGCLKEVRELARQSLSLSGQLKQNRIGQSILLEIANLARQGNLTLQFLEQSLERWQSPWKARRS